MLTRTGEYVLRAMVYLVQNQADWPITGKQIAEQVGIPANYLSNILRDLVRAGILDASPGKNGGFRMRRSASDTMLCELLEPFESHGPRQCPFGNKECSDLDPCLAHAEWKHVVEAEQGFLQRTSIEHVAVAGKRQNPSASARKARKKSKRPGG